MLENIKTVLNTIRAKYLKKYIVLDLIKGY